ncbi:hypothetical protein QAD02_005685, partial [Eretmocerus hayati]
VCLNVGSFEMSSMDAVNTNGIQENDGPRRIDILSQIQNGFDPIQKNTTVFKLLYNDNYQGRMILYSYLNNISIEKYRGYISLLYLNHELSKFDLTKPPITCSRKYLEEKAEDIIVTLPNEGPATIYYEGEYESQNCEGKTVRVRANDPLQKAWDHLRNVTDEAELEELLPNKFHRLKLKDTSRVPVSENLDLSCLMSIPETIDETLRILVLKVWGLSYSFRIDGPQKNRSGIVLLNYYKILQTELGIVLVKEDFKKNNAKYEVEGEGVCSDRLICKWPAFSVKLISLTRDRLAKAEAKANKQKLINSSRKKNKSSDSTPVEIIAPEPSEIPDNAVSLFHAYDDVKSLMDQNSGDLRADHAAALAFMVAALSLKLTNFKCKNDGWRPLTKEILHDFIVHSKNHENLAAVIRVIKEEQTDRYDQEHPYIIYCGDLAALRCCHVIYMNIVYDFQSAITAVDFLMKFFIVLKIDFPLVSLPIWGFLLKCVFLMKKARKIGANASINTLMEKLNESFNGAVREEVLLEIKRVLDRHKSPFEKLDSESKRLAVYEHLELYREPKLVPIASISTPKLSGNQLDFKHSTVSIVRFPLAEGLKRVIEIEESEEEVIVLPLFGYHDDVQPGNALGSHASETNLGTFYAQIACMPSNFASKMSSIVVSDIFMSKDRKTFGNEAVFSALKKDARYLRRVGIRIQIKGKWYRVKFVLCLILGDNLGLNSIFEFIPSFSNTLFCRMCYAGPDLVHILVKEDVSILRTIEKYEDDLASQKPVAETGLHGRCVFNELDDFHVISNSSLDVMHDQFEGMCNYVMALILLRLIKVGAQVRGYFELSELNRRMRDFNFGFETSNIPPDINYDYLKKNERLKMSSSEMLFFVRYFGILVGDLVPTDNIVWGLYLKLREIMHILTCPFVTESMLSNLDSLITEHHELYIRLFGFLKAKFHLLLHYIRVIRRTGPVIKTSCMRFEVFHQIIKKCIESSNCHINTLKTIGIRLQLSFMSLNFNKYEDIFKTYVREQKNTLVRSLFPEASKMSELKSIVLNGITYSKNTIIVVDYDDDGVIFGQVQNVFLVDDEIIFRYLPLKPCGFNQHYFAYKVIVEVDCFCTIPFKSLASHITPLMFEIEKKKYVVTRHSL